MDQWKKHPTHNSTKTWTSYRETLCLIQGSITMLDEAKPRKEGGGGKWTEKALNKKKNYR